MAEKIRTKIKKVLFYTHSPRAFRATLIGHLYEIAQIYPTILLSEKLDAETENALKDKDLFPQLQEIIPVRQYTGEKRGLFAKNRYFHALANSAIQSYNPDILITANDVYPFEIYLIRAAQKAGALTIVIEPSLHSLNLRDIAWQVDRVNAYFRFPSFFPFALRVGFVKIRKYAGYLLSSIILPLLVGEVPRLKSSVILYSPSGFLADYSICYSKEDYLLSLQEGVSLQKLSILRNPLWREATRKLFEKVYFFPARKFHSGNKKTLLLLFPFHRIGFRREDRSIIGEKELEENNLTIVSLIAEILQDWNIIIKMHPDDRRLDTGLRDKFQTISRSIETPNPDDPIDRYIEISDTIVALDEPSTALFTASLQCPDKRILTIDLYKRWGGDFYKNFEGVEYIDNKEKLIHVLEEIRGGIHQRNVQRNSKPLENKEFSDTVEALEYLFEQRNRESRPSIPK